MTATPEQFTAFGTCVLAIGVLFAWRTLAWQRRANRVTEAGNLVREWYEARLRTFRRDIDKTPNMETNRTGANERYGGDDRYKKNNPAALAFDAFIEDTARLTERMEVYVRNGVAEERIIAELLCYDVAAMYYIVQDILEQRAKTDNLNYEGWRDLTLRVQDLSRIRPKSIDLSPDLKWYDFPPLKYRIPGDVSEGYDVPWFRRPVLAFVNRQRPEPIASDEATKPEPLGEG